MYLIEVQNSQLHYTIYKTIISKKLKLYSLNTRNNNIFTFVKLLQNSSRNTKEVISYMVLCTLSFIIILCDQIIKKVMFFFISVFYCIPLSLTLCHVLVSIDSGLEDVVVYLSGL